MATTPSRSDRRWRRAGLCLLILVGVVLACAELAGLGDLGRTLTPFTLGWLWCILPLALASLLVKALRWHMLVAQIVDRAPLWTSVVSYVAGQGLVLAPGGFALRQPLLDRALRRPSHAAPALLVQEGLEALSLVVLAGAGLVASVGAWRAGVPLLVEALALLVGLGVVLANDRLSDALARGLDRVHGLEDLQQQIQQFRQGARQLLSARLLGAQPARDRAGGPRRTGAPPPGLARLRARAGLATASLLRLWVRLAGRLLVPAAGRAGRRRAEPGGTDGARAGRAAVRCRGDGAGVPHLHVPL